MDFVRFVFGLIKRRKKPQNVTVNNNPATSQDMSNNSSPQIITHVHNYSPNYGCTAPLDSIPNSPTSIRAPSYTGDYPLVQTQGEHSLPPGIAAPPVDPPKSEPMIDWAVTTIDTVDNLSHHAVIGGYDYDSSPLWVIRTIYGGQILPAKLNIRSKGAYVAWNDEEHMISVFEVLCILSGKVVWKDDSDGYVPKNAIEGGKTSEGEKLYIGRATHDRSLIPGKIQPSQKCCFVTYAGQAHRYRSYEVLCVI